jgi:hypothetical protein
VQLDGVRPRSAVRWKRPWLTVVVLYCPLEHAPGVPQAHVFASKLPRSPGRPAHERGDERGDAEEGQEGEERDADDAVLSGHEAHDPSVEKQARAEHDDACPEPRGVSEPIAIEVSVSRRRPW